MTDIPPCRETHLTGLSPGGLHRIVYSEWGERDNPRVLLCVHGLTRCGSDFDELAAALSGDFRVICPDLAGRGRSDWLKDAAHYTVPQYLADLNALIARLGVDTVDWLGTSLGGLLGMLMASFGEAPVGRLILNDFGPTIEAAALSRIGENLGRVPRFPTLDAVERHLRAVCAPFGDLSAAQWRRLAENSVRPAPGGGYEARYDPRLADVFRADAQAAAVDLWAYYDRIRCPVLAVRGAESDLLSTQTWRTMAERGPRARLAEVPGVGHAPMFTDARQVALVRDFLASDRGGAL